MTTPTAPQRQAKPKKHRRLKLIVPPLDADHPGVLRISEGVRVIKTTHYFLTPVDADYGLGFLIEKFSPTNGECYATNLDLNATPDNLRVSSCECQGFLRHGHCKHLEALLVLRDRDLLPQLETEEVSEC